MYHGLKFKTITLFCLILSAGYVSFFARCAHVAAPPGGPADSIPPYIKAVFPVPGALNQSRDLNVVIEFSEWMNKNISSNGVIISPSIPRKLKLKPDGNRLEVSSGSVLDSNTTYIISALSVLNDLSGHQLDKGFNLTFSTGPELDSLKFFGEVYNESEKVNQVFLALYPVDSVLRLAKYLYSPEGSVPDSVPRPDKERPMYLIPADSTGKMDYSGIRAGTYSLLAFEDDNLNLLPDIGREKIGISAGNLKVSADVKVNIKLSAFDTTAPDLAAVQWTGERIDTSGTVKKISGTIGVKFSREMDLDSLLDISNFILVSPDSSDTLVLKNICFNQVKKEIELFPEPLYPDSQYLIICRKGMDVFQNQVNSTRSFAVFRTSSTVDSSVLRITPVSGIVKDSGIILSEPLKFHSSKLLTDELVETLRKELICLMNEEEVAVEFKVVDHRHFTLKVQIKEYNGQSINILRRVTHIIPDSVRIKSMEAQKKRKLSADSSGNKKGADSAMVIDSVKVMDNPLIRFVLAEQKKWGKCRVSQTKPYTSWMVVLKHANTGAEIKRDISARRNNVLDSLAAGKYLLRYFHDRNGNRSWDAGSLDTWSPQELSGTVQDTVMVESKKTVQIDIKGAEAWDRQFLKLR